MQNKLIKSVFATFILIFFAFDASEAAEKNPAPQKAVIITHGLGGAL